MAAVFPANQVIVVGGGLAGMSAANTVVELGGRTILLDKSSFCGGNSTKATSGINGAGTKTQKGKSIPDTAEIFIADTLKGGAKKPELAKVLCANSAADVDWLVDKFDLDLSLVARLGGHSQPRTHRGKERFPGMTITYALIQMLEKVAEKTNRARIVTKAEVYKLLVNAGTVVGCEYKKAGKTVKEFGPMVLASGGFGADFGADSLLATYRPDLLHLPTTNGEHCTGDAIKMGEAIGAATIDLEWVQVHPTGLVKPDDPDAKVKFLAAEALRGVGGIVLDSNGDRFCNELGRRDYVTGEMWKNKPPFRLCLNKAAADEIILLEGGENTDKEVETIQKTLTDLVESGDAIEPVTKSWKEAHSYFKERGLSAAATLLTTRTTAEVACYQCRGVLRLNLFPLHERAAALKAGSYALIHCKEMSGFVVAYTKEILYKAQPALQQSHSDHKAFCKGYEVRSVGNLNSLQQVGRGRKDFVLACEFRQETKIAEIVAQVKARMAEGRQVKVICIAGPTSSGKTTFATKLCMYLQNNGFVAKPLTVDHYYLPLDRQPKYQARKLRSDVDYDHIESMDVELICQHLNALVSGESVMAPVYNMKTGYRDGDGTKFDALPSNGILVIEGIHALNPLYTKAVSDDKLFKIFISPLTSLQLDDHNCVKTTHHRLLRRMSRDYLFRGNSAARTLAMWDNVRKGEGVWIFPHQNNADFVMNSAAEYEIPVLKTFIEPLLRAVTPDDETFPKAQEILKLLDLFATWPPELAPPLALLREFVGDGAFDCH